MDDLPKSVNLSREERLSGRTVNLGLAYPLVVCACKIIKLKAKKHTENHKANVNSRAIGRILLENGGDVERRRPIQLLGVGKVAVKILELVWITRYLSELSVYNIL